MSGHKQHSQQTPPRFRIGKRAFEHGAEAGKGECARINAYMQKHFNDILSFLSRFLTVRERPKLYSRELRAAEATFDDKRKGFL